MAYRSDMLNQRTCTYRAYDIDERLLYVGISMNLPARLEKHRRTEWWPDVEEIVVEWFDGRDAARASVRDAILHEAPIFNVARPARTPRIREVN